MVVHVQKRDTITLFSCMGKPLVFLLAGFDSVFQVMVNMIIGLKMTGTLMLESCILLFSGCEKSPAFPGVGFWG